jgi:chaperonin GroES
MKVMNLRPLHDRVVVETLAAEKKAGSIILPELAQEKPHEGKVVAVGSGYRGKDGKIIGLDIKKGDRVIYGKWSGTEVKVEDKKYLIMKETDILGVVEGAGKVAVRERGEPAMAGAAAHGMPGHIHDDDCCDD